MKPLDFVWVFVGSGFGGCMRYLLSNWIGRTAQFPISTLIINVLACLIAGFLASRLGVYVLGNMDMRLLLITGFCGGFSTFSAFGIETFELIHKGFWYSAFAYLMLSMIAGVLGVLIGMKLKL